MLQLMNKDILVAEFDVLEDTSLIYGKLPMNFRDILGWVNKRTQINCAESNREFYKHIGLYTIARLIDAFHCVSLHDTFWLKRTNDLLTWNDVSPFRNTYSDVISTYALEGITLDTKDKNYFSPVVGNNGSFPHTWIFTENGIKFVKASSKYTLGGTNSGREPYSEYYASIIADYLGFNHVKYSIRNHLRYDGKLDVVTECDCYTSENIGTVTAYDLGINTYEELIEFSRKLSKESYITCVDMLFLDCLLLNTDRHFENIEFFVNNDTQQILGIAPIFDNNYSFLPRFVEGYNKFNRDEYKARDGRTFDELYNLVKSHKYYTNELLVLKKLRLSKPDNVDISIKRISFLNSFLQMQIKYLLSK